MIFNQLNCLLTQDSMDFLSSVMSDSPIDLDLTKYQVEIITTLDAVTEEPTNVYSAKFLNVRVWYDAYLQRSSLIATLESSDLQKRALQLCEQGAVREFHDFYNPHLVIRPDMPTLGKHARQFIRSLGDSLCGTERTIELTGEYVSTVDLAAPLNADYNKAMWHERSGRRNY